MAAGVMPGKRDALARFGGVDAVNRSATSIEIPGKKKIFSRGRGPQREKKIFPSNSQESDGTQHTVA